MKKNYIKLIIVEILILIAICFNTFISSVATEANWVSLGFWLAILIALKLLVGFAKNKHLYKIDVLQLVFIYSVSYLILIYVLGLFTGFVRAPYNLMPTRILQNTLPIFLVIILQELVRYAIIAKGKANAFIVWLTLIIFIAVDISIGWGSFPISDGMSIFVMIGLLILPAIANNSLLTYISYKNGYGAAIMYRVIFGIIAIYMVPFYPNFGPYVESVLAIVFPVVLFLKLNSFLGKEKPITRRTMKLKRFLFWAPTATVLTAMVILISGLFRLHAMAIGSGSMSPAINKGDVVIIEKLKKDELSRLEIGDVIAFEYQKKIIVHRIENIKVIGDKTVYYTKGDYNNNIDNWELEAKHIKGLVRYKIPYIGYPSVWLSEALN